MADKKTIHEIYMEKPHPRWDIINDKIKQIAYSVTDFNIIGNGITDNTKAMNDLINKVSASGGGKIIIPANFTISVKRLQMRSNVHLEGSGWNSVIKGHPGAIKSQYNTIFINNDVENASVKNLTIDANGDNRLAFTEPADIEIDNPIRLEGCKNVLIENVQIINSSKGFAMNLWSGYREPENRKMLENIVIRGCHIDVPSNGFQGIAIIQGKNILVENNVVHNNKGGGGWGIVVESNSPILSDTYDTEYNSLQNITVRNNTIVGTGVACIGQGLIANKNINFIDNTIEITEDSAAFQTFMIHDVTFERNNIVFNAKNANKHIFYINGRSIRIRNNNIHLKQDCEIGLFVYGQDVIAKDTLGTAFHSVDNISYENNSFAADLDFTATYHMRFLDSGKHLVKNNNIPMSAKSYALQATSVNELTIVDSYLSGYWGISCDIPQDNTIMNISNTEIVAHKNMIKGLSEVFMKGNTFRGLGINDIVLNDLTRDNETVHWSRDNVVLDGNQDEILELVKQDNSEYFVSITNFKGSNDSEKIQKAINHAFNNKKKVVMLEEYYYTLTSPIIIKSGVELRCGKNTKFSIVGNFKVFEIEQDACFSGGFIGIDTMDFNSDVFTLNGKNKMAAFTAIKDVVIKNWSTNISGTAIHLYSNGVDHFTQFVKFENIYIQKFEKGIHLEAIKPTSGGSWVNANKFDNITLEGCANMIVFDSTKTIPAECSGNIFTNLQIQPMEETVTILKLSGQANIIDGILWDIHEIQHDNPIAIFSEESIKNDIRINFPIMRIQDNGVDNKYLDIISGAIPIEQFGAIGNGSADDTEAFRNAIKHSVDGTKILLSKHYMVNNVWSTEMEGKKNISFIGSKNAKIGIKPNIISEINRGTITNRVYEVKDYLEQIDVTNLNWVIAKIQLQTGRVFEYIKVPDKTKIPNNFQKDTILRGEKSRLQFEISHIDDDSPDGANTARIYFLGTFNDEKHNNIMVRNETTGVINERLQVKRALKKNKWFMDFKQVVLPAFVTVNKQIKQTSGKLARISDVFEYTDRTGVIHNIVEIDSHWDYQKSEFYDQKVKPINENENFSVIEFNVDSMSFASFNKWENVLIENITFDGSNYLVGMHHQNANDWNIIYSCASKNLTIRNCVFKNSVMSGIHIGGAGNSNSEYSDYPNGVLIDNCQFENNGRNDIEIIYGQNINVTNCSGDGALDVEANGDEMLDNIFISNNNFHTFSPYSPSAISSNSKISVTNCNFIRVFSEVGAVTKISNSYIHQLSPYNGNSIELTSCVINKIDGTYGQSMPSFYNCEIYGLPTVGSGSFNSGDFSKLRVNSSTIDLSFDNDSTIGSWVFDIKNSLITSLTRNVTVLNYYAYDISNFENTTFNNVTLESGNDSGDMNFYNCKFLLKDINENQTVITSWGTSGNYYFQNCYIQSNISLGKKGTFIDCILDGVSKPELYGYAGTFINGLKSTLEHGIDWGYLGTPFEGKVKFNNVSVSKNIPSPLGIFNRRGVPSVSNVQEGSTVLYMDDVNKFSSVIYYKLDVGGAPTILDIKTISY